MTHKSSEATREYMKEYYKRHKERIIKRVSARYSEKRDEIIAENRQKYADNREERIKQLREYVKDNKDKHVLWMKKANAKYRRGLKAEVVEAYGGACQCCGERILEFLSVEHIGQWGARHRREQGWKAGGVALYKWLKENGFPKDKFGILCMNCQFATKHGKPCPHQNIDTQSIAIGIAC